MIRLCFPNISQNKLLKGDRIYAPNQPNQKFEHNKKNKQLRNKSKIFKIKLISLYNKENKITRTPTKIKPFKISLTVTCIHFNILWEILLKD